MQYDSRGLMLGEGKYAKNHRVFFLQFVNFSHRLPYKFMFRTVKLDVHMTAILTILFDIFIIIKVECLTHFKKE